MKIEIEWKNMQDLTFGEWCQVEEAVKRAVDDKLHEIRRDKILSAGKKPSWKQQLGRVRRR